MASPNFLPPAPQSVDPVQIKRWLNQVYLVLKDLIVAVGLTNPVQIENGGTGGQNLSEAQENLGITPLEDSTLLNSFLQADPPSDTHWSTYAFNIGGTLTTASSFTTVGAFAVTQTYTAATNVTFPTSGTLATVAGLGAYLPLAGGTMTGNIVFNSSTTPLGLSFTGTSGNNQITLTPSETTALSVTDNTNTYLKFNSTPGRPRTATIVETIVQAPLTMNGGYSINFPGGINNSSGALSASQSLTTVTGSGTSFSTAMIGGMIFWPSTGAAGIVKSVASTTSLTVDTSQTQASAPFQIFYGGMNLDYAGIRQMQGQANWFSSIDTPPSVIGVGTQLTLGATNSTLVNIVPTASFSVNPIISQSNVHGILVGQNSSAITSIIPVTAGQVLQSTGTTSDPAYTNTLSSTIQSNITSLGTQALALNMGSHLINNVTDPASAQDAATRNYTDTTFPTKNGTGASGTWGISVSGNAATVTTNANLTGDVTSSGNATTYNNAVPLSKSLNANLTASNGGIFYSTASAGAILAGTTTPNQLLMSGASTTPAWSTATYPTTASTAGKVLISDGTNIVSSTPTFPNASASSGKFIRSDGTNWVASTPTLPTTAGTSGKILQSDGTNYVESTPTYPSASGTAGKILRSDGTNNVYSTSTFADTYSANTVLVANSANTVIGSTTLPSGLAATNISLTTPSLGVATATSINGNTITTGTGTLTIGTNSNITSPSLRTYSPVISDSAGNNFVMSAQNGSYIQYGNTYFIWIDLAWSGKGSAVAGNSVRISLPTTIASGTNRPAFAVAAVSGITATQLGSGGAAGNSFLSLYNYTGTGSATLLVSAMGGSGFLQISGAIAV